MTILGVHNVFVHKARGFTLIELTVVTILAITAMIVIPDLSSTDPARLDMATEYYASAIRFARHESIRTGKLHGFEQTNSQPYLKVNSVDNSGTTWTFVEDVYNPITKQLYSVELKQLAGAGGIGTSSDYIFHGTCSSASEIYFDSNGSGWCLRPNGVALIQYNITLSLGTNKRTVSVDGVTGRVTIQ